MDALAMAVDLGQWHVNYYGDAEGKVKLDPLGQRGLLVSARDWPGSRSGRPVTAACVVQAFHDEWNSEPGSNRVMTERRQALLSVVTKGPVSVSVWMKQSLKQGGEWEEVLSNSFRLLDERWSSYAQV